MKHFWRNNRAHVFEYDLACFDVHSISANGLEQAKSHRDADRIENDQTPNERIHSSVPVSKSGDRKVDPETPSRHKEEGQKERNLIALGLMLGCEWKTLMKKIQSQAKPEITLSE